MELALAEQMMTQSLEHAKSSDDEMCIGCVYRGLGEIMNGFVKKLQD